MADFGKLIIQREGEPPQEVTLTKETITLGRATDNDVALADSRASRHHARLTISAGRAVLTDLKSANGTLIGGNKKLLTDNANDSSPAWSPGGGYVLFTSNRSGNLDVWLMRADGSGLQQLTSNPTSDGAATWSPDGNFIFFRSDREGSWAIYMMNDDGSNQRKIVSANVSERWWWERISVSW